jgi:hypothetical protein
MPCSHSLIHPDTDTNQSYHDLAVRLEPVILELEREQNDLLIIAHESVLRVLYGYLMACNATDIPKLTFPRNEIIEVLQSHSIHSSLLTFADHSVILQQCSETNSHPQPSRKHGSWQSRGSEDARSTFGNCVSNDQSGNTAEWTRDTEGWCFDSSISDSAVAIEA